MDAGHIIQASQKGTFKLLLDLLLNVKEKE